MLLDKSLLGEFICLYANFTEQDMNDRKILHNTEVSWSGTETKNKSIREETGAGERISFALSVVLGRRHGDNTLIECHI